MATIAFGTHLDDWYGLNNFTDSEILRLELPAGSYIIFGKTTMWNKDSDHQTATVRLTTTTMGGETDLDRADVRLAGSESQEVSLQAHLELTNETPDRIVELRAQTWAGGTAGTKLYAIQVDALKMD
jgi:hypothetical protein